MNKLVKPIVCLAILGIVVSLSVGCVDPYSYLTKANGGGWFTDVGSGSICEFGFNINLKDNKGAEDNDKTLTGQFQFNDTSQGGVEFHLHEMTYIEPEDPVGIYECAYFKGINKKTGMTGTVFVCDLGEPADDYIKVSYNGNDWDGYIEGGNIQTH